MLIPIDSLNLNEGFSLSVNYSVNTNFVFLLNNKKPENTEGHTFFYIVIYYICVLSFAKVY